MKRKILITTALAAALVVGAALVTGPTFARGPGGWGRGGYGMGPGMGYGMMGPGKGYGMMGPGMGYGMMGSSPGFRSGCPYAKAALNKDLTIEDVTKFLGERLESSGNDRLKVGDVQVVDGNTIIAEIVTKDGALVQKLTFDRATGRHGPVR